MRFFIALALVVIVNLPAGAAADPWSVNLSPEAQQRAQYEQMQASEYRVQPGYFAGACSQVLALASAPVQILQTFTNHSPEIKWWARIMPGGKLFHTLGTVAPIQFVTTDGVVVEGMGRLSLGAPPIGGRFLPGFAFVLYEEGRDPIGIHAIHSLSPQNDTRFFLNDFSNKLPNPGGIPAAMVSALSFFIHTPLHLDTDPLLARLDRAGARMLPFLSTQHVVLRAPDEVRDEHRFLLNDFRPEFRNYRGVDNILFSVLSVGPAGERLLGHIRIKDADTMPFIASRYGDRQFHVPHYSRTWARP